MERRMFLFSGLFGLLPLGRRRRRRCKSVEVGSVSYELLTIQYETRDKIGNIEKLFADAEWRPRSGSAEQRVAHAFLPRDRAFTYYIAGIPKIWWGICVVIQYRYSDPYFLSAVAVYAVPDSIVEGFPAGLDQARKSPLPDDGDTGRTLAKETGPIPCYAVNGGTGEITELHWN